MLIYDIWYILPLNKHSAGPHWNPHGKTHGGPDMEERHAGDLGNIEANADGVSEGSMEDSILTLIGEHTIIGRSMMVCLEHSSVVMFHYS